MMITRRALVFGLAANPLAQGASGSDNLVGLGQFLDQLKGRCTVLETQVQRMAAEAERLRGSDAALGCSPEPTQVRTRLGYDQTWQRWSDTVAELEDTIIRILSAPARSPSHLLIKHRALVAQLELDDPGNPGFLDELQTFGRDLEKLVG